MSDEGPLLEELLRRLSECPSEFIQSCQTASGARQLAAIVCDHFRIYSTKDDSPYIKRLLSTKPAKPVDLRYYSLVAISVWLLHDNWFLSRPELCESAWNWIQGDDLHALSAIVASEQFVADPDRREELVRTCLAALKLRPQGETQAQADDRRTTLNSIERQRVLATTAAAERRAREIREAMAKQKALESASRYGE